jgi:Ca2+-binding EF-hand superfamily protein
LRQIFDEMDPAKTGAIRISELKEILKRPGFNYPDDSLDRIFKSIVGIELSSLDPNTLIDYNKFLDTMRKEFGLE